MSDFSPERKMCLFSFKRDFKNAVPRFVTSVCDQVRDSFFKVHSLSILNLHFLSQKFVTIQRVTRSTLTHKDAYLRCLPKTYHYLVRPALLPIHSPWILTKRYALGLRMNVHDYSSNVISNLAFMRFWNCRNSWPDSGIFRAAGSRRCSSSGRNNTEAQVN